MDSPKKTYLQFARPLLAQRSLRHVNVVGFRQSPQLVVVFSVDRSRNVDVKFETFKKLTFQFVPEIWTVVSW